MKRADHALVAVALLIAAPAAVAQEISLNRPGSGARAAGMGNAFIAVSDDGTAASWNPAGLSQLRQPEFSLVQSTSRRNLILEGYRLRDLSGAFTSLTTPTTITDIEFASAAVPFSVAGKPVTFQGGWRRLYRLNSRIAGDSRRIPTAPDARPESLIRLDDSTDGSVDLWSLAGAVRLTSRLFVGASVDFYRGGWKDQGETNETPGAQDATDFISFRTSNRIGGHNLNFGLLLSYPSVRVGLVHHGALQSSFEVTQSIRSSLSEPVDLSVGPDGAGLHFPRSLGLGVAWLPRPLVRLALDFTYDEWTKFLVEGTPGEDRPLNAFDNLPPELSATRNTVTVNAGMEKLFPVKGRYVPLRAGFSHEPQGARDPLLRDDSNHTVLAAGTGLNSNSLKLDVAVEYRWGSFRNARNVTPVYKAGKAQAFGLPLPPEAEGTTRIQEFRLKVSLIYRITNTEKLKDVVKKVFGS